MIDYEDVYKILISSVVPRPIAWVSTISKDGLTNLAPFSFFNVVSSNPPMLAFSPASKEVEQGEETHLVPKDTLKNVSETGEFVINIVTMELAEKMNQTSGDYPPNISEFDAVGLTAMPSKAVRAPRVGESPINFECRLHQIIEFGKQPGAGNLVIGEVLYIHINDDVYKHGRIDVDAVQPVGRLFGNYYTTVKDRFQLARPKV